MKNILNLVGRLLIICAVMAAVLGFTNAQTAPVIEERAAQEAQEAFGAVYPDAEFEPVEDSYLTDNITTIMEAYQGGEQVGYVFEVNSPSGYGGPVTFAVGVDNEGIVTGFQVLNHSETQGFGAAVEEPAYAEGVAETELSAPVAASGDGADPSTVPQITGATLTTGAMEEAFNMVVEKWAELTGNTVDMSAKPEVEEEEEAPKLEEVSEESLAEFTGADSVTALADAPTNDVVQGVYEATGGDAEGTLFHAISPDGYAGPIEFVVGVADDGSINFFTVVNHGETAGFGGAIEEPAYNEQITSSSIDSPDVAISGASFTTGALEEAFTAIQEAYNAL